MIISIGSYALSKFSFKRTIKDYDFICNQKDFDDFKILKSEQIVHIDDKKYGHTVFMLGSLPLEFEIIEKRPTWNDDAGKSALDYIFKNKAYITVWEDIEIIIPNFNTLYALKTTHKYRDSVHFQKTRKDLSLFESNGAYISEELKQWVKNREKETLSEQNRPILKNSKSGFFTDHQIYVYEHDHIHAIQATVANVPAYEFIKDDKAEVFCSKAKFFSIDEKFRLACAYEESVVLALERSLIPFDFKPDPRKAFIKCLEKLSTVISSGWFRKYCYDNFDAILEYYDNIESPNDYVSRFHQAVADGILKKIKP